MKSDRVVEVPWEETEQVILCHQLSRIDTAGLVLGLASIHLSSVNFTSKLYLGRYFKLKVLKERGLLYTGELNVRLNNVSSGETEQVTP